MTSWEQIDSQVHSAIVNDLLDRGYASNSQELIEKLQASSKDILDSLRRLAENHALVPHPDNNASIWVIHPFSLSPTSTYVEIIFENGDKKGWWAPCMWCALGIVTLASRRYESGRLNIHATLEGETERIAIEIKDGCIVDNGHSSLVVHFPMPLKCAWNNVHHFCACVLPFKREEDVKTWCARHGIAYGQAVPILQAFDLAKVWYGKHADVDWVKWNVVEAQGIFDSVGLTGPFWALVSGNADRF